MNNWLTEKKPDDIIVVSSEVTWLEDNGWFSVNFIGGAKPSQDTYYIAVDSLCARLRMVTGSYGNRVGLVCKEVYPNNDNIYIMVERCYGQHHVLITEGVLIHLAS
jgi:hypothetical protein